MDYLSSGNRFAHLSLEDLLRARDQFHAHLVHKRNVIGTAVGRYLIRKDDPQPGTDRKPGPKPARTLENSEIRDYSWPCVLVFVDRWADEDDFGKRELPVSDFVPKTIYMEDGKSVPICVVLAPRVTTPPRQRPAPVVDPNRLQGGCPVISQTQNVTYRGTVGCLLTDGHKVYALTSRHVAGAPNEKLYAEADAPLGVTSALQLSRVPFEEAYAPWRGKQAFVNFDVALIEVEDLSLWSSGIESIGAVGPLAALSTYNLSLNLIGCPVRAFGAASGPMEGRIAALFYRYKSVGGFDYMADFLIGSRGQRPLPTLPGDSGSTWVVDGEEPEDRNLPIAVQWGGAVLGGAEQQSTFALASNLSTICRQLDVDLYRGPSVAAFEYWGPVGHKHVGQFATRLVRNANLKTLLQKNFKNIGSLANYPDNLWKNGSRPDEGINHYADVDLSLGGIATLQDQTPDAASLSTAVWRQYYADIAAAGGKLSPGLLPFRVWQVFNELVRIVRTGDVQDIVAAMGILAHYIGDPCQTLHSSYLTDGDPFRKTNGSPAPSMIAHGKPKYGLGTHSAYESKMISANEPDLQVRVSANLPADHGLPLLTTGREAAWETMELMRRSRERVDPMALVESVVRARHDGEDVADALWGEYGDSTIEAMIDGCSVLAMLWDSAWEEGNGDAIQTSRLVRKDIGKIRLRCTDTSFLPSSNLATIELDE